MNRVPSLRSFCSLALALGFSFSAAASDIDKYLQTTVDAGNRTVAFLINRFRPVFPADNKDLLDPKRIRVEVWADFNAYSNTEKREIIIPAQFVSENLLQVQGFLLVQRDPSLRAKYLDWVRNLSERSLEAKRLAVAKGSRTDDIPVVQFWSYAGRSSAPALTDREERLQDDMMIDAMALIVGHELGHIVFNHARKVSPSKSREQEYEADAFAARLLRDAKMSVIPGLSTFFLRFAASEGLQKGYSENLRTHPPAECRFERIGSSELELSFKDPEKRRLFEQNARMPVSQFREYIAKLRKECG